MSETNNKTAQDNDPNSWRNREIGAIWSRVNNSLSLSIKNKDGNEVRFIAFPNKFKTEDKHPSYRIYREIPRGTETPSKPAASKPEPKPEEEKEPDFV